MPDPLTPAERYAILLAIEHHIRQLRWGATIPTVQMIAAVDAQFVRESIADACAAIDAAVAPVPTEEEIASASQP